MAIDTMTIAKQAAEAVFQSIERHGGIVMDHVVTAIHDKLAGALAVSDTRTEPYKVNMIKRGDAPVEAHYTRHLRDAIKGVSFDGMIVDDMIKDHAEKVRAAAARYNHADVKQREREFIQKMMGGGLPKGTVDSVMDFMKRNHVTLQPYQVAAIKALRGQPSDGSVHPNHDLGDRRDRP